MTSSTHHSFNVHYAAEYGVHEAILIHHFQHWIEFNQRTKKNYREGRTWSYQTFADIAAWFPYFTADQVRDLLHRLCEGKNRKSNKDEPEFEPVLMKGNFNKTNYDKTLWYAFQNEEMFTKGEIPTGPMGISPNGVGEIPEPIPDAKTDAKRLNDRLDAAPMAAGEKVPLRKEEEVDLSHLTPDSERILVFASNSSTSKIAKHAVADVFRKYLDLGFSESIIKEALCKMLQKNPKLSGTVDSYFQVILTNTQKDHTKLKRSLKNGNTSTKPSNKPSSVQGTGRYIVTRTKPKDSDEWTETVEWVDW